MSRFQGYLMIKNALRPYKLTILKLWKYCVHRVPLCTMDIGQR